MDVESNAIARHTAITIRYATGYTVITIGSAKKATAKTRRSPNSKVGCLRYPSAKMLFVASFVLRCISV